LPLLDISITSVHVKAIFVTARMRNESYGKVKASKNNKKYFTTRR